ncbi:MAG: O-antigen ligase family protein [Bacteroidales bacterium]
MRTHNDIGNRYGDLLVYGSGILFIIVNALLVYRGTWYLMLFPFLVGALYLAFFSPVRLFMAVVFLTPLSVELSRIAGGVPLDLYLPTEPLIILIMIVVLLRLVYDGTMDRDILYHPVSLAVLFYLLWILITTMTSTMPLVSVKFLFVRLWFITVFYFLAIRIFRRHSNIRVFLWCYIAALMVVVFYTLYNHAAYGFIAQRAAHWVVRPFYNDHTAYGAALAMFIPVLAVFAFRRKGPVSHRRFAGILLVLFAVALVFSYSRAAWLSIVAAFCVWVLIRLRIGFGTLLAFSLTAALLVFLLRNDIVREMERNTQDSSADFREHIRSMTNITSDASNLERLNRWKAALAMFREKPLLGWGPGTYMFRYAPFQVSYDRTIISTNMADGGDAHSEYLGPLSETGLPGMLSFIAVVALTLTTGFRLLRQLKKRGDRLLATGVLLGLTTYLVHGFLNNFLHSDKAAVPFWGFAAILVAMDLYRKKVSGIQTPGW